MYLWYSFSVKIGCSQVLSEGHTTLTSYMQCTHGYCIHEDHTFVCTYTSTQRLVSSSLHVGRAEHRSECINLISKTIICASTSMSFEWLTILDAKLSCEY